MSDQQAPADDNALPPVQGTVVIRASEWYRASRELFPIRTDLVLLDFESMEEAIEACSEFELYRDYADYQMIQNLMGG